MNSNAWFAPVMSCLAYSVMSNCMVLANRYLVGSHYFGFEQKTFVVMFQAILAVLLLEFAKAQKLISYESYNSTTARKWAPVTGTFVAMLYTSTLATAELPIHIVIVFKNVTNIGIVLGEWYLFHEPVSLLVFASLLVMLIGAAMASFSDVEDTKKSTITGYFWMMANCICTASYVLYMRHATSKSSIKLSKFGMAYYNNIISIPLLLPIMVLNGEVWSIWNNPLFGNITFVALLILSGIMGIGLNLSSFWCVSVTSATTYATVGALNKLPTTFIGVLLLGETLQPTTAMYVLFGMLGGMLYGYAKFKERQQPKTKIDTNDSASKV